MLEARTHMGGFHPLPPDAGQPQKLNLSRI